MCDRQESSTKVIDVSLFRNRRLMLDEMLQRNTSNFAIVLEYENTCNYFSSVFIVKQYFILDLELYQPYTPVTNLFLKSVSKRFLLLSFKHIFMYLVHTILSIYCLFCLTAQFHTYVRIHKMNFLLILIHLIFVFRNNNKKVQIKSHTVSNHV